MNAIEFLTRQHLVIDRLIHNVADASGGERVFALAQLAEVVRAHVKLEEGILYPAVLAKPSDDAIIGRIEEHLQMKRLLAELIDCHPDDDRFDAILEVMRDLHEEHAHGDEEHDLFPSAAELFSGDELRAMGLRMQLMYDQLIAPDDTDPATAYPVAAVATI